MAKADRQKTRMGLVSIQLAANAAGTQSKNHFKFTIYPRFAIYCS
jgi:hypothetical protein